MLMLTHRTFQPILAVRGLKPALNRRPARQRSDNASPGATSCRWSEDPRVNR